MGKKGLKRAFSETTKFREANLRIFINVIVKEEVDDCIYLCLAAFFSFVPQNQVQILTFELQLCLPRTPQPGPVGGARTVLSVSYASSSPPFFFFFFI